VYSLSRASLAAFVLAIACQVVRTAKPAAAATNRAHVDMIQRLSPRPLGLHAGGCCASCGRGCGFGPLRRPVGAIGQGPAEVKSGFVAVAGGTGWDYDARAAHGARVRVFGPTQARQATCGMCGPDPVPACRLKVPVKQSLMDADSSWPRLSGISDLERLVRDIPDFPKPGVLFKDITPLLKDAAGLALAVELVVQPFRGRHVDLVCGAESRGFIFGTAVARELSAGFVPIRKPGKLPNKVRRHEYALEYGTDALEIHEDAIRPGQSVLVVDDLLATGGTLVACCELVSGLGGAVLAVAVLIELVALGGRKRLGGYPVYSVLRF
jgi:adenine phosphoribosyltransferase